MKKIFNKMNCQQDELCISIKENIFNEIMNHAKQDLYRELGGVLLGGHNKKLIYIEDFIKAEDVENSGTHIKFTHKCWEKIFKELDSRNNDMKIIGWYHTHPGMGVFLSSMDRFIVENFFNMPYQVSLVIDPVSEKKDFFRYYEKETIKWKNVKYED